MRRLQKMSTRQKKALIILMIILPVLICISSHALFFREITASRYNKIMFYYIARNTTCNSNNFDEKIVALRDLVHENIHHIGKVGSHDHAIQHLLWGNGWCDQQSRVFMWLARGIGITSRLLFLKSESGSSPHSVAEVLTPDKRWVIVDSSFGLDLVTKDGKLAGQEDIKKDLSIITDNKKVKLASQPGSCWADPKFIAIYYNTPRYVITRKGVPFDFLKLVPPSRLRPIVNIIQKRYLKQLNIKDKYELKMLEARNYHLLGYHKRSKALYDKIINDSNNLQLIYKAEFYEALLLKDEGKYQEAVKYINEIIKEEQSSSYLSVLMDLKTRILEKM